MEIKTKVNKWDIIKLKSFCITKETISKVKRQPSGWEKIIANEATDKELVSKIYKQFTELKSKNNPTGLPWWSSGSESAFQCRGCRFIPGQGTKISYAVVAAAKLLQSCPNLCERMDCSPPGSSVPGILPFLLQCMHTC